MKRSIIILVLACAAQEQTLQDIVSKACPQNAVYALTSDEAAILNAVAAHYRKYQWSVEEARRTNTFVWADFARHAVPSQSAPQVLYLTTMPFAPSLFDPGVRFEMLRHGVDEQLATALINDLHARNQRPTDIKPVQPFVSFTCADLIASIAGRPPTNGNMRNAPKMISWMLPAFDSARSHALVLSSNEAEFLLGNEADSLEAVMLERNGTSWRIAWHSGVATRINTRVAPATSIDFALFDAVLAHLDNTKRIDPAKCVRVVNEAASDDGPSHSSVRIVRVAAQRSYRARRLHIARTTSAIAPPSFTSRCPAFEAATRRR